MDHVHYTASFPKLFL